MTRLSPIRRLGLAAAAAAGLAAAGCETVPSSVAPPGAPAGGADLALGHRLYYGRCAACHAPEPIDAYTRSEWREMVAHMRKRAKLTPAEEASLVAYLMRHAADA